MNTRASRRPGSIVACVILLLALVNIVVLGVILPGGREAELGAMRIETARALYAAESATTAVVRLRAARATLPAQGSTLTLPNASAQYVSVPSSTAASGTLIVQGTSGTGGRRLQLTYNVR